MPYALELALDDEAAAVVRTVWRDIATAGFPLMVDLGANPHISLAIWNEIERDALEEAICRFAAGFAPVDIVFHAVASFASTGAVFLAPAPNQRLRDVHEHCHRMLAPFSHEAWPHYAVGVWVPHCTLAMDLDGEGLERVMHVARRTRLPLQGRLVRAELMEFRPVRRLMFAPLRG
jgi:2'-5' RNA ligase